MKLCLIKVAKLDACIRPLFANTVTYIKEQNELEITKAREMANIETEKFNNMVQAIGSDTISAIATSGPEMQVKLLQSLGLRSTLITDGSQPVNLFTTAQGLLGDIGSGPSNPEEED